MGPLALTYTIATLVMFGLCALAGQVSADASRIARAAAWMAFGVGVSRIVSALVDPPWSMAHYPAQDLFMMAMCLGWYQVRREIWASLLASCFMVQLFLHAAFWWGADPHQLRIYITLNNAAFVGEILILCIAGGRHVAAWVGRRLPVLRRRTGARLAFMEAAPWR